MTQQLERKRQRPPQQTVQQQVAALAGMGPAALREKYLAVFGEAARTGNKTFLYKRLAWRLQSLAEGGLSERARRRAEELARDADVRTTAPKAPAITAGAADRAVTRPAPGAPSSSIPPSTARAPSHARVPIPGTVLTREYRGAHVAVTVLADGRFEYQGQ